MKSKRVLYTDRLSEEIRNKLRIIKYDKIKSKKSNVFFVYFASEEDAEYATKACKRIKNIAIKAYESKLSPSVAERETSSLIRTIQNNTTSTTSQTKVKLMARYLAPNSSEICQLFENIDSCLNAMNIVKHTFDQVYQLEEEKYKLNVPLFSRLYTEHSTALYMKMTLAIQLKTMFSSNLRLTWSMVASQLNLIERHVYHEQTFMKNIQLKQTDLLKRINYQSSITTSSKLAYELIKLTEKNNLS